MIQPTRFEHGLVIGKFYPPHEGHAALVRCAAANSELVTVVVMAAEREGLPLDLRVAWLRETFAATPAVRIVGVVDELPVDYESDAVWAAQVALMRAGLRLAGRGEPDAVFTSEPYGAELARRFRAADVRLDRSVLAISGTEVRADLPAAWWKLPAATRAGLTTRVVLVGAESTGKTTLAEALAVGLRQQAGAWGAVRAVPEYGREWWMGRVAALRARVPDAPWAGVTFAPADFEHIAATQTAREEQAARAGGPALICDTDAFATALWAERYLGRSVPEVPAETAQLPGRRLYLLMGVDGAPFVQDGWRDGEQIRAAMDSRFRDRLEAAGADWVSIDGDWATRAASAWAVVERLLDRTTTTVQRLPR